MTSVLNDEASATAVGHLLALGCLTLPVAPQQASLASSITTLLCLALSSSNKYLATAAPLIPEPIITTSASAGRVEVVRWPSRTWEGSLCQNEAVECLEGKAAMAITARRWWSSDRFATRAL